MKGKWRLFNIGFFNVRGLTNDCKKQQVTTDITKYNIDICCLQEAKLKDGLDITINSHRIICLLSDSRYYGNGFIVSSKWKSNIQSFYKASDRISVIRLQTNYSKYKSKLDDMKMKLTKTKQRNMITVINGTCQNR